MANTYTASSTSGEQKVPNVLEKICADKAQELIQQKIDLPLDNFVNELTKSDRSLFDNLSKPEAGFILECKKASPSKGLIRPIFDLDEIITAYQPYAAGISVLTDKKYFQGDHEYLKYVRENVTQPCICKDFFIDPYQVHLARYYGADVILLMLSVLDDTQYNELAQLAEHYNLDILTEVSNEVELERALKLNAKIIGINNRNLRDLSTDLNTTKRLAPQIRERAQKGTVIVSESGIYTHDHVSDLSHFADGFLVGSSIMAQTDLPLAVHKLIVGENKVCGLTRPEDAKAAKKAGAVYGGLIFVEQSKRYVEPLQAQAIINAEPNLSYVGVFVNSDTNKIIELTKTHNLSVVQLHGDEDQTYIDALKSQLDPKIEIWKAHNIAKSTLPSLTQIDRWLLDSGNTESHSTRGGTGETFDWQLIKQTQLNIPFMLAGGITPDNAQQAAKLGAIGLDLNSGVEISPGVKSTEKLTAAFHALRQY